MGRISQGRPGHFAHDQRMDHSLTRRAAYLASAATVAALALTIFLGRGAVTSFPGWGQTELESGLLFLLGSCAALLSAWIAVVLAHAAWSLWRGEGMPNPAHPGISGRLVGSLSTRVAVGLLALVSTGAPAVAQPGWVDADEVPMSILAAALPAEPGNAGEYSVVGLPETPEAPEMPSEHDDEIEEAMSNNKGTDDEQGIPLPQPGWTPTPAVPTPAPTLPSGDISLLSSTGTEQVSTHDHIVVQRGDSLWSITARHLGPHATAQDVADVWPQWYAANQHVIGDDPDLLLPGQQLRIPPKGIQ